jgi:hypothetical protein
LNITFGAVGAGAEAASQNDAVLCGSGSATLQINNVSSENIQQINNKYVK